MHNAFSLILRCAIDDYCYSHNGSVVQQCFYCNRITYQDAVSLKILQFLHRTVSQAPMGHGFCVTQDGKMADGSQNTETIRAPGMENGQWVTVFACPKDPGATINSTKPPKVHHTKKDRSFSGLLLFFISPSIS